MFEFYVWTRNIGYLLTFIFALSVLSQSLATVMSYYRHPRNRKWVYETLLELFILGYIMVISLLHGQAMVGYTDSIFAPSGYIGLRIVFFAVVALFAVLTATETRKSRTLLIIAGSALTFPIIEQQTGGAFAYLYIAAVLYWFARSITVNLMRYQDIRTHLSSLSIKNAIDTLRTGVMFCEQNGFGLLTNTQMQKQMLAVCGQVQRNGRKFHALISSGEINPDCKKTELEGQTVILLPDSSAWIFTLAELPIGGKTYVQLTATDISERWALTAELQAQSDDLSHRQVELNEAINNLYAYTREKETQRAKTRTHDLMSERIALFQQSILQEQAPDQALLRALSQGLLAELKATESGLLPSEELEITKKTYAAIGVEILLDGNLPEDNEKARLTADIIRESVNNAVRHGFATQVNVQITALGSGFHVVITDNGRSATGAIQEGSGITGMRRRLMKWGGELTVSSAPRFTLAVTIP